MIVDESALAAGAEREARLMRHNTIDALGIRRRLDRTVWGVPHAYGPSGWIFDTITGPRGRIIVSDGPAGTSDAIWRHESISRAEIPTYDDLVLMHRAIWGDGWAYQVFAPPAAHINIHAQALHLWGRPDGQAVLPNFGANGSI